MREITVLILALAFVMSSSGCVSPRKRFPGWEQVRVEKQVPNKDCKYIIQEACNEKQSGCYNWLKKRAITRGANTVVITETTRRQASKGSVMIGNAGGGAGWSSEEVMSSLADLYNCPEYKAGERK